ncbi:hypothetical protein, partial [Secundilactobacillus paracollinoides]|uniref:hypothetical protein n=1 Tax=Secundilactobacillus paracollinoides TaxID=240427 RepID=UPI001CDA9E69
PSYTLQVKNLKSEMLAHPAFLYFLVLFYLAETCFGSGRVLLHKSLPAQNPRPGFYAESNLCSAP